MSTKSFNRALAQFLVQFFAIAAIVATSSLMLSSTGLAQQSLTLSADSSQSQTEESAQSEEESAADAEAQSDLTTEQNLAIDALIVVLNDETLRQELLDRLQQTGATDAAADTSSQEKEEPATTEETPFRNLADQTSQFASNFYASITGFWRDVMGVQFVFLNMTAEKSQRLQTAAWGLLVTILVTLATVWLVRRGIGRGLNKLEHDDPDTVLDQSLVRLIVEALSDLAAVVIAFAVGYGVSIAMVSGNSPALEQSLFLNAFLIAGFARTGLSMLVHNSRAHISVFDFSQDVEANIYNRLVSILSFCIYGLVFVVPVTNSWANFASGRALRIIIVSVAAVAALVSIQQIAKIIRTSLREKAEAKRQKEREEQLAQETITPLEADELKDGTDEPEEIDLGFIQYIWPTLATIYVLTVWIVGIAQPHLIVSLIGMGSAKILGVIVVLLVGTRLLKGLGKLSIPMPRHIDRMVPDFKKRLELFLPHFANALIVLLFAAALLLLADGLGLVDLGILLNNAEFVGFLGNILSAIFIIIAAILVWSFVSAFIDEQLAREMPLTSDESRKRTLLALFKNAFTIVVLIFALMTALSQIGLDIAPLLAGAGVVGLAIGFGAQKLVQDVITGVFIQIENAINVGDVVTAGGITGGVEKLTVRSVGMRDLQGTYHIVPFSAVDTVSNFNRNFAFHVAELGVAYKEDIGRVKEAMRDAFEELKAGEMGKDIYGDFEMHGVTGLGDSAVNVRGRIKTRPGQQWAIGRQYTEIVKRIFDDRDIEIPFPHRTMVYQGGLPPEVSVAAISALQNNTKVDESTPDTNDDD